MDLTRLIVRLVVDAKDYKRTMDLAEARMLRLVGVFNAAGRMISVGFSNTIGKLFGAVTAMPIVQKLLDPVRNFFSSSGFFGGSVWKGIANAFSVVAMAPILQPLFRFFSPSGLFGGSVFRGVTESFKSAFKGVAILTLSGRIFNPVVGAIGMIGRAVVGGFGALVSPTAVVGMTAFAASFGVLANHVVRSAAEFERTSIALEVMTGSKAAGMRMLQNIVDLAVETPFRSRELTAGAKQLKGFGFNNDDVIPVLKVLGDVSAGTGTPLDRIILAFGQVRTASRLMGTELRQFVDAGVPMFEYLAKVMQVPESNIKKLVESGAVSYEHVKRAFNLMVSQGGPYFMLMDRLSQTTAGRWEAFTENLEVFGRNIGLSFFRGFGTADLLNQFNQMTRELSNGAGWLDQWFVKLRKIFDIAVSLAEVLFGKLSSGGRGVFDSLSQSTSWADFEKSAEDIAVTLVGAFEEMLVITREIALFMLRDIIKPIKNLTDASDSVTPENDWSGGKLPSGMVDDINGVGFFFKRVWKTLNGWDWEDTAAQTVPSALDNAMDSQIKKMEEDNKKFWADRTAAGRNGLSPGQRLLREKMAARTAATQAGVLRAGLATDEGRAVVAALNPSMSLGLGIANVLGGKAPAQIAEAFMPQFFTKDKSRFPGTVSGGANNDFQNTFRQIDEARRFLFKKEVGIGGLGGGGAIGGVQWAFQNMANAEFLEAFDKLEKSVGMNTKQQNAGAAALKGSQEAIAVITRSEGAGKDGAAARVEKVMNAVKDEMKRDADNSGAMKDALNKWLENNPGVISREP